MKKNATEIKKKIEKLEMIIIYSEVRFIDDKCNSLRFKLNDEEEEMKNKKSIEFNWMKEERADFMKHFILYIHIMWLTKKRRK